MAGYIGNGVKSRLLPEQQKVNSVHYGVFEEPSATIEIPNGYQVGTLTVFINGVVLNEDEYVANDSANVDLLATFDAGTVWRVEENAVVNSDISARLLNRENHTGTQPVSTVTGIAEKHATFNLADYVDLNEPTHDLALERCRSDRDQLGYGTIYIPAGTWNLKNGLVVKSGDRFRGEGKFQTIIRLTDDADLSTCGVTNQHNTGGTDNVTFDSDIAVEGIGVDANVQRFAVDTQTISVPAKTYAPHETSTFTLSMSDIDVGGRVDARFNDQEHEYELLYVWAYCDVAGTVTVEVTNGQDVPIDLPSSNIVVRRYDYSGFSGYTKGCAWGFSGAQVTLRDIMGKNAPKHSMDYSGAIYSLGDDTTVAGYSNNPSNLSIMDDVVFMFGGDDNFTTHSCENLSVYNFKSFNAAGTYIKSNTNCCEIDDASRSVSMHGVFCGNGEAGIEIKAHQTAPAACRVMLYDVRLDHCRSAFDCHHTDHGENGEPDSPTAGQVSVFGLQVRYARNQHVRVLSGYRGVSIFGLTMVDDGRCTGYALNLSDGAVNVTVDGVFATGFNMPTVIFIQDYNTRNISLSNGWIEGGTLRGAYLGSGVKRIRMTNFHFIASSETGDKVAAVYSYSPIDEQSNHFIGITQEGFSANVVDRFTDYGAGQSFMPGLVTSGW